MFSLLEESCPLVLYKQVHVHACLSTFSKWRLSPDIHSKHSNNCNQSNNSHFA